MADIKCQWCGQLMIGVRSDKKYCSRSCGAKASRERLKNGIDSTKKICPKCGNEFQIQDNGYNRRYCYNCIPLNSCKDGASMRRIIKKWALDYKGNQCCLCGYNKCIEALEFHHLNQNEKEFSLSDKDIKLDWEEIKKELDKCILICSNCHREIHAGLRTNEGEEVLNENVN